MAEELIGINEDEINKLVLSIYDDIEKINGKLNSIDKEMDTLSSCFDCSAGKQLQQKYSGQKAMFQTVSSNLLKYTEQLLKVKERTVDFDKDTKTDILKVAKSVDIRQ